MQATTILIALLLLSAALVGSMIAYLAGYDHGFEKASAKLHQQISSFEDCAAAGYPIMESYPEQCAVPGGPTFTRTITTPLPTSEDVYCTQDAQECPDGSFVGRVGPRCEFAPCPGE